LKPFQSLKRILLDAFPLFTRAREPYSNLQDPFGNSATTPEVTTKLGFRGKAKIDDALLFCSELMANEERRRETIESKGTTLVGIAGISTAFITGFGALLLDRSKISDPTVLTIVAILYTLVDVCLLLSFVHAAHSVNVRKFWVAKPRAEDIFGLADHSLIKARMDRVASLYVSYVRNCSENDRKATFVIAAQNWYRNAIVLLLLAGVLLGVYAWYSVARC
jgi:hypothetical protein